ncbi:BspA family leucine-rich repeat surface protein [Mycoplasma sp. 06067-C1-B144P-99-0482-3]|uniref:BspA family leucine-rich repeat surface protein n=1 Tax=Mycoplasma sp. 06067-C1-B144P-99-0482-3 TaxID=3117438 RepID=UPI003DA52261
MKKLLTILGSVGLVATTSAAVIACGNKTSQKTPDKKEEVKPTEEKKEEVKPTEEKKEEKEEDKNNEEKQKNEPKPINTENDKKNSEVIKAIVKEQEDAFATFHNRKDFLDQIKVFAKEKGIENLKLANGDENTTFVEGNNNPENKVKLRLGTYEFDVHLGSVLKDRVATKYYIENDNKKIIEDQDDKFSNLKNNEQNVQNVVITQIGYSLKKRYLDHDFGKTIQIYKMPENTKKVPKHLPLKIKSLENAFKNFKFEKVLNLDNWNVSNVINMESMFYEAEKFNQNISKWNTENVKIMTSLFIGAKNFNQPLNSWNVSNVSQMSEMFREAINFNQDLNDWDVSNVTDMESMFQDAKSFNGKIDKWNVEKVEKLGEMFLRATKFSQDLSKWKIKNNVAKKASSIFDHTYKFREQVLKAWEKN